MLDPMNHPRALAIALSTLISAAACGSADDPMTGPGLMTSTLLDLKDVKANPTAYEWFDFRPNVKKLILAGAAETEHVAILWYTVDRWRGGAALSLEDRIGVRDRRHPDRRQGRLSDWNGLFQSARQRARRS